MLSVARMDLNFYLNCNFYLYCIRGKSLKNTAWRNKLDRQDNLIYLIVVTLKKPNLLIKYWFWFFHSQWSLKRRSVITFFILNHSELVKNNMTTFWLFDSEPFWKESKWRFVIKNWFSELTNQRREIKNENQFRV